jgi:putative ABC transport system ATP-binding protein
MTAHSLIETINLQKIYGMGDIQVMALAGIDLQIDRGEFLSIMGPSGSGKSTLMNILGCLDRPSKGQYFLDGEDISQLNRSQLASLRNQRIGFIFQSYNLLPRTSALRNVMLPLIYQRRSGLSLLEREEKAMTALEAVGLADRAHHEPMELSGGQQQRVAIARALINDPVLILADEPTGNLDTTTGAEIMELLHDLHSRGRTLAIVTHEQEIADETERTIILRDGKIEIDGPNGSIGGVTTPALTLTRER